MKYRAEHVLVAGRRKSAVIFGANAAEKIRRVDRYEEPASLNDSIMFMTLLQEFFDSRERKFLDSGSGRKVEDFPHDGRQDKPQIALQPLLSAPQSEIGAGGAGFPIVESLASPMGGK